MYPVTAYVINVFVLEDNPVLVVMHENPEQALLLAAAMVERIAEEVATKEGGWVEPKKQDRSKEELSLTIRTEKHKYTDHGSVDAELLPLVCTLPPEGKLKFSLRL